MKINMKSQIFTELLKNKCVVTSLLDNFRSRWISFLKQFTEPNCPKRTVHRKVSDLASLVESECFYARLDEELVSGRCGDGWLCAGGNQKGCWEM